jgi:hypothetical protein
MSNFNYQDYLRNNPLLKEEKRVGELTWKFMSDDERMDALLSVVKDPDEASEYVELDWKDLPARINPQNMRGTLRLSEQLEFDEDFGTGDGETLDLASDVVFGRISYKEAREKASKASFSMKELNNAIAYVEDLTGRQAPNYSIDEDYDPDAEQDDEDVPNPVDDEGRPLGEIQGWGSSDQFALVSSMHRELGKPSKFPSLSDLIDAAESATDFYMDDFESYEDDKEGLVMMNARSYARQFFPEMFDAMKKFAEPLDEGMHTKDPRQIEAEREIRDQAKVFFLQKVRRGEIDTLPEDPFQAYMDMLTQDQMDHDAETLRREIDENKMNKMNKMDKINERLNVARDALTKVYNELGATTFSKMILNLRDENVLDELANEMGNQYRGVMQEARDYGMTYPSYNVKEFNTIGDMAQNGILNLLAFAEQHKPELAGKLKSLVNDVTEVIYDDMEEFDTRPRIRVKETIKEQVEEMVKGAVKVFQKEGGALGVKALEDGLGIDTKKAKALLKTMIKKDLVFLHRDGDYILKEGHGLTADDIKVIEKTIDDSSDAKLTDILKFIVSSNIEQAKRADLSKGK